MPKPKIDLDNLHDDESPATLALATDPNAPLYLDPHSLINAENVRPLESADDHDARVQILKKQLKADGQQLPVKIASYNGGYRVIDGQGRVDALRELDNPVWCVLDDSSDPWATAVKLNVQRRNYNPLQLSSLIVMARARYDWDKKGGGKKCADFFGISEQDLVAYNKLADAPADVKSLVQSGTLSMDAALKLLKAAPELVKRAEVSKKATEIAALDTKGKKAVRSQEEIDAKYRASRKNLGKQLATPVADRKAVPPAPVKVQSKHIAQAAREVAAASNEAAPAIKRNRTELLAAITQLIESSPENSKSQSGREFLTAFVKFANGEFSPRQLSNRWNPLVGVKK